jgi:hypothetical protein
VSSQHGREGEGGGGVGPRAAALLPPVLESMRPAGRDRVGATGRDLWRGGARGAHATRRRGRQARRWRGRRRRGVDGRGGERGGGRGRARARGHCAGCWAGAQVVRPCPARPGAAAAQQRRGWGRGLSARTMQCRFRRAAEHGHPWGYISTAECYEKGACPCAACPCARLAAHARASSAPPVCHSRREGGGARMRTVLRWARRHRRSREPREGAALDREA